MIPLPQGEKRFTHRAIPSPMHTLQFREILIG
jgi:hypothetical protein